ncbi:MAG: hypothetical protein KDA37_02455, partial [Planctomycetales bacterium]|nr:hypothetical protein [Planctomycetales bacterium]
DYTLWRDNLGGAESTINNNGDGLDGVDAKDYLLWRQNYGGGQAPSAYVGLPAPEPLTPVLLATATAAIGQTWSRGARPRAGAPVLRRGVDGCRSCRAHGPL